MSPAALPDIAPPVPTLFSRVLRGLAACLLFAICGGILALAMSDGNAANRDFVSYWAAGQRLVHHADPYDSAAIFQLEQSAGWSEDRALLMRNPPFALFLTIPLGFVSEKTGAVLWSLMILATLMAAIRLLRDMNGNPPNRLHLLGYLFAPSMACMLAGQSSGLALLGLTLFLYLHRTRPQIAGAALVLCALKPHLFLPFAVVLLVWTIAQKAFRVVVGATLALAVCSAVPLFLDPSVYANYAAMARTSRIEAEFVPTLGEALRIAIHPQAVWLQFLPAVVGCIWAVWYFRQHRNHWEWSTDGSILMLISLLVAPYSWFTDQVVLLPAIFQAIYAADASPRSRALLWFVAIDGVALMEVLAGVQLDSPLYIWAPAAWTIWYVCFMRQSGSSAMLPVGRVNAFTRDCSES
jgi:hypothetical protein